MRRTEAGASKPASGLRNSLANVLGLLVPLAVYLGATPFLVSGLGADRFGVLTLFVAAVFLVGSFDFGLATGGVRALGQAVSAEDVLRFRAIVVELRTAMLLLGIFLAVLVYWLQERLLVWAGLSWLELGVAARMALPIAILSSFLSAAFAAIPRAHESFVGLTLIQVAAGMLTWVGAVVWVILGHGLEAVLPWFALVSALACLALAWWASRWTGSLRWLPAGRFPELRRSLRFGLHAFAGQMAAAATYHADKFLVSHFLGVAAAGYYGLASGLAFRFLTLVAALSGFVFPRAVRMTAAGDMDGLRQTYLRGTRYVLLVAWPVFLLALMLGMDFLRLWVGPATAEEAGSILLVLLVAYFVASLSVVASQVFNGLGNARIGAIFSVLGGVINLIACLVLLPRWGLMGAALASLLSMLQVFGYTAALHRRLELPPWPFLGLCLRIAGVSLVPLALLYLGMSLARDWIGLSGLALVAWLAFYVAWFGLGQADAGDRGMLRRILMRG